MTRAALDADLLAAHAAGDRARLALLYTTAADTAPTPAERAFFLTQAWVFSLDAGLVEADTLRSRLVALGADR
ncbi:hypothetical protein HKCCE2091_19770 [Rhodobacterales bacterium HKCCE2091]|nr:hypothetical protein [Rhodobacterales bacterium HKCCE2091]